jgi:hypothetical protein
VQGLDLGPVDRGRLGIWHLGIGHERIGRLRNRSRRLEHLRQLDGGDAHGLTSQRDARR